MNSSRKARPTQPSQTSWPLRATAVGCIAASVALAAVGLHLLFAGNWLQDHTVRYGALALLAASVVAAIFAIVLAVVGAFRQPHEIASWVIVLIAVLSLPVGAVSSQLLGI